MYIKNILIPLLTLFLVVSPTFAQSGVLKGKVLDANSNESVAFADILIENTNLYSSSDEMGEFRIENIPPGVYNISVSSLGYETQTLSEMTIGSVRELYIDVFLVDNVKQLDEVEITSKIFKKNAESPISVTRLGATEIYRSPGANRDISSVVQTLPGVATTASFRNDLIVRGGAPGENKFYLDGIEIPNINHFATQGSSGGPVGMINVNFIKNVDFYTGSFPSSRGNALSSIMDITSKKGNTDKFSGTLALGSSDFGLTIDTPTGENSSMLFSVRQSYLQFLFEQLKLPFLPTYTDFQYGHHFDINDKNQIKIIGLGAIDNFSLNETVNEGVTDEDTLERNTFILNNLPVSEQWNYAIGVNWKRFTGKGYQEVVVSRNMLNNTALKYRYNDEMPENLLLDYQSQEIENKLRWEWHQSNKNWQWYIGAGLENVRYTNDTQQQISVGELAQNIFYQTDIRFQKYSLFGQASRNFLKDQLTASFGLRTDNNDYSSIMSNPLSQLSPRISLEYSLNTKSSLSTSIAKYYQLPAYTILGYKDNLDILVNKQNEVSYFNAWHFVTGYQYQINKFVQLKTEGFYKVYDKYPFSVKDNISLANLGSDFGVIGNTEVLSNSQGRSYGFEFSAQQKLTDKFFGFLSYTYVRSEFQDMTNQFIPSSWDNKHILNITSGYKLPRNWEVGAKFRLLGGAPYTPYDVDLSSLQSVWDINQQGVLDYGSLNEERLNTTHGLDIRFDKKWYFKKWSLNAYIDLQNAYNFKAETPAFFNVVTDENGIPVPSNTNPSAYEYKLITNESGTILPSIGLMIDF